jgi:Putative transposase
VNVLARLFRGKFLTMLTKAHTQGRLKFFNTHAGLADKRTFKKFLAPLRKTKWVVYCKDPFAGPEQMLRYLSPYTHRVAICNCRLVSADDTGVAFRWKDYRVDGPDRWKTMTRTSSSAACSCTCCPRASTASVTTACLPMATAPPTSHALASCSVLRRASLSPRRRSPPRRTSRAFCPAPARAAAVG